MSETTETLLRKLAASNVQLDAFHDRQNARLMLCIRTLAGIEGLLDGKINMRETLTEIEVYLNACNNALRAIDNKVSEAV